MEIIKVKDYDAMSEAACSFMVEKNTSYSIDHPGVRISYRLNPEGLYQASD